MESSDSSQSKISAFLPKTNMTTKDDDLQYSVNLLRTESSGSKDSTATVCFDKDLSEKNVKEPMSEDQTEPMTTFIDVDELNALSQLGENSEQNTVTDSESVTQESMTTSNILAPTPMDDLRSKMQRYQYSVSLRADCRHSSAKCLNAEVAYRTAEDHCRITCYYLSIDNIVTELKCRFEGHDQEVLLALADVVFEARKTSLRY